MIRIYMDWNVMSQMKNNRHPELLRIISDHNRFYKIFSTAHISDILSSFSQDNINNEINEDLDYITFLTNNECIYNNGSDIVIEYYDPKILFENQLEDDAILRDFKLDNIYRPTTDEVTNQLLKNNLDTLKRFPIGDIFKDAFSDPSNAEKLNILFPGLKENPTMDGMINSILKMVNGMNEDENYKDLRKIAQEGLGINRDQIFHDKAPYKLIEKAYDKLGVKQYSSKTKGKNAPIWFDDIINEYILLDMHGYQEDKVNVGKGRKETFKNTTQDSFHAAFASTCNFYLTNDTKSYKKTKEVYNKLQLNTIVQTPKEFVEYYNNTLKCEDWTQYLLTFFEILKTNNNQIYDEYKDEEGIHLTYYLPYFLFDFFNKIYVSYYNNSDKQTILMSKQSPSNFKFTTFQELSQLIEGLNKLLGSDIDNLGELSEGEFKEDIWTIRKWPFSDSVFRLMCLNGYFQLYFDL